MTCQSENLIVNSYVSSRPMSLFKNIYFVLNQDLLKKRPVGDHCDRDICANVKMCMRLHYWKLLMFKRDTVIKLMIIVDWQQSAVNSTHQDSLIGGVHTFNTNILHHRVETNAVTINCSSIGILNKQQKKCSITLNLQFGRRGNFLPGFRSLTGSTAVDNNTWSWCRSESWCWLEY